MMEPYDRFNEGIENAAKKFKSIDKNEVIRVVSHLDADGISACSIMIKLLENENRKYSVSIIQQLDTPLLNQLALEPYNYLVFTDMGSGAISRINNLFKNKKVFILDHHSIEPIDNIKEFENITFVNPHLYQIDGGREISGAGVVFKFASTVDPNIKDFAHIAIIGAIGDLQEKNGFLRLNKEILEIAVKRNKIKVTRGLRIFGTQTRPLYKALEYCTDPYIPGVTGSESGSIQFLNEIGIEPKRGKEWKKIIHLNDDDMKKLVGGIIMKRLKESDPEDVLGDVYTLPHEEEESPTKDAKEFATLLNACGRLGKASLGIGVCLGDKKMKKEAIIGLSDYRREIVNALKWYNENKFDENIFWGNKFVIINGKNNVMPTMIGTLASILSKSNLMINNTFILSMANSNDSKIKVSLRATKNSNGNFDLKKIIEEIIHHLGDYEAGGHQNAAGAIIPLEKESKFLESAKEVLAKYALEERIN